MLVWRIAVVVYNSEWRTVVSSGVARGPGDDHPK